MTSSATGQDSRSPGGDGGPADVDGAVQALAHADPQSFYDAAQRFDRTAARLRTVSADFRGRLRHLEQAWQGEGFEAFSGAAEELLRRIGHSVDALAEPSYANLLTELGDAVAEAKRDVDDLRAQRDAASTAPGVGPQAAQAEQDARAQEVLRRLGSTYSSVGGRFRAPPENQTLHNGDRKTAQTGRAADAAEPTGGAAGGSALTVSTAADGAGAADGARQDDGRGPVATGAEGQQHAEQQDQSSVGIEMPSDGAEAAGSIWSSVLPAGALPAAAVIGREKRKRDEKKRRQDEEQNAFEENAHGSEDSREEDETGKYGSEGSQADGDSGKYGSEEPGDERGSDESGKSHQATSSERHGDTDDYDGASGEDGDSGDDSKHPHDHRGKTGHGHRDQDDVVRTFSEESAEDENPMRSLSTAQHYAATETGAERIPDTAPAPPPATPPSAPSAPAAAAGSPTAAAVGGGASALRLHLGAPVSAGGVAPPPPTGVRSDASALSVPSEPSTASTAHPATASGQVAGTASHSGVPPMNPRTMGGQPEQQETGHQERDRNVAQREDPETWEAGVGLTGVLGREVRREDKS
ncbi:WXG100 family type VII secretion target [Saccharopolyspora sp. NPDC000359]|uniref:WXG100 family type VII secretion target n=1 Tax=Saccharopolyspora sp. NPDC000359 TaxID=3154251 RepID=UPI003318C507